MAQDPRVSDSTATSDSDVPTTSVGVPPPRRRSGLRTFSSIQDHVDFRYLFFGNLFANGAQWLQVISVGWLAWSVTEGSEFHSIMAVAVRALPTLILGPWAGVLIDRWDRRKLAMGVQVLLLITTLVFATFVARGQVDSVWYIYAYTMVTGVFFTIKQPVRQALIANTVPRSAMPNALALSAMSTTSMRLAGAILGGVLLETVAFHWNFYFEAGLYVGVIVLLIPMRTPYQEASTARQHSPLANLKEGLGYIFKSKLMRQLMVLNFSRTAVFMPLLMLLPVYTSQSLDAGPAVGTAMMFTMGVGGVIATFIMSTWGFFAKKGTVCLITMLSGSGVVFVLGLSHWIWLSVPIMIVMGLSQSHFIVSNQTLVQTIVPDTLRGRVSSVWHYEQALIPMFAGGIGLAAGAIGIGWAMTIVGGVALVIGTFYVFLFNEVRGRD